MFDRRSIPTPFPVGDVNAYIAGRTIVDPGPDSDAAWDALTAALGDHGLEPEDVERVILTHSHPDHFGLAKRFRDRGATVAATPIAADVIEDFETRLEGERSFVRELFARHGMDREDATTLTELTTGYRSYAPDCPVDRLLTDGDTIEIGSTTVSVGEVSGHAASELLLSHTVAEGSGTEGDDPAREPGDPDEIAIVGDHVLAHITPNPLLRPPLEDGGDRPKPLLEFNASLPRLRDRGFDRLLPGHGDVIDDPAERIDEILAFHEERTDRVASILDDLGTATAYEVMRELFPDLSVADQFAGMSEAIGHLDVLIDRDRASRDESGNRFTYEPA